LNMPNYHCQLRPGQHYHIFSRAVGFEKLFREDENCRYFIQKLREHILPVCSVWAYCLLPNHFHLLIEIKEEAELQQEFERVKKNRTYQEELLPDFIMERFSNFLNSYTKAFNKRYQRKGSLFLDYIRRVEIVKDSQFSNCIFYIHRNPVHHDYVKSMSEWEWSSYSSILFDEVDFIEKEKVLEWYGGKEAFLEYHSQPIPLKELDEP
jgi:putative transposase